MNPPKRHLRNAIIIFVISSFAAGIIFQEIVTHLNSSLISNGGDGIKNYYTYLYQVQHGSGTHFQGMNYPYGEHVIFTDNMPLLVWLVQGIGQWMPGATDYALGIMHFLVLISIPVGCVFMYKILIRFGIPAWLAGLCGIIIVFSCQQYMKIEGHFGMAFMGYIPMMLYWLMLYDERRKIIYPFLIFIFTLIFAFFHLYNLAISTVLIVFYSFSFFIIHFKKSFLRNLIHTLPIIISILVPTVIVKLFLSATDQVTDRPDYPYGVFGGATEGKHIFLNPDAPMGNMLQFLFGPAEKAYGEGSVYLGLVSFGTFLFVLTCCIAWLVRPKKHSKALLTEVYENNYSIWLLTGFFALLLGMGVPISWGWDTLIDHIATIRQFRTVGRFSWIFYFIFQIFVVLTLFRTYRYLISKDKKTLATVITVTCIAISFIQSFAIYNFFKKKS
ncbi:MAG: hypothetical protein KL787_06145 [Taibaiella sp.]|nr:hypothetical protein [Taibaiella sp.]